MSARAESEAGFTLVEALVSLFVFGLIAAGSVAMLVQSAQSQRSVSEAQAALAELQTTRALLAADMLQLAPRQAHDADGRARPSFVGGDDAVALGFTRAMAEPDEAGASVTSLVYVEYLVRDGALVRRTRQALDATAATTSSERVMIAHADAIAFEFFDGAQWRQQWRASGSVSAPPRAVALVADLPRYGRVRVQALVGL